MANVICICWKNNHGAPYEPKDENDTKHAPLTLIEKYASLWIWEDHSLREIPPFGSEKYATALRNTFVVLVNGKTSRNTNAWTFILEAIRNHIKQKGNGKNLNFKSIILEANKLVKQYFKQQTKEYSLITSLSIKSLPTQTTSICGCKIAEIKSRQGYYSLPEVIYSTIPQKYRTHMETTDYTPIRIRTKGRTPNEAARKAFESLDLLTGIWNYHITYRNWRFGPNLPRSIAAITTGPIHTIHHPNGKPALETYWYTPSYVDDRQLHVPFLGWSQIEKKRKQILKQLSKSPYKQDMISIFLRYSGALDTTNMEVAFINMWGILEKITDTVGARYDDTIKRASWIFPKEEQSEIREILQTLRIKRNQVVHAGSNTHDQIIYLIKYILDPHLGKLINNDFKVNSLQEYGRFLDSSSDLEILKKQKDKHQLAIRIRKSLDK